MSRASADGGHWGESAAPSLFRVPVPAAPNVLAQPDCNGRAGLAVWSLAARRLDTSPFGDASKTDCRQSITSISSAVKLN